MHSLGWKEEYEFFLSPVSYVEIGDPDLRRHRKCYLLISAVVATCLFAANELPHCLFN